MSKRKANNHQKRMERVGKSLLKDCAVSFVAGGNGLCNLVNIKKQNQFTVGPHLAKTIAVGRYMWSVYCAVFCRDQTGKEYMQSVVINTQEPCRQDELLSVLHENHLSLLNGCNELHTLNVGWLASPVGHDWSEKEAGSIFTKLNAWDFKTKAEGVTVNG